MGYVSGNIAILGIRVIPNNVNKTTTYYPRIEKLIYFFYYLAKYLIVYITQVFILLYHQEIK